MNIIRNSKGQILYGMHFYPGVAEYQEEGQDPYRVFLNEDTIRKMDPSFAGRPVFVDHVDEVDSDLNKLRGEADGWVIESFYNSADGKHWVKFIVVTEKAERAVKAGFRLSNAYLPKGFKSGGVWNGVSYLKEVSDAEYEHLALVDNPRYDESVIMTPDKFKEYNEKNIQELKKLSNSKKKESTMKFSFFKRTKVENAIDPDLQVVLPKSGKTISITDLITNADEKMVKEKEPKEEEIKKDSASSDDEDGESSKHHVMADDNHMLKMHDGSYMKVKDAMGRMKQMNEEMEALKKKKEDSSEKELDLKVEESDVDAEGDLHNDEHEEEVEKEDHEKEMNDDSMLEHPEKEVHDASDDSSEDKSAKKKALQLSEHEDKEIEEAKKKNLKKKNEQGLERAKRLRNAHLNALENSDPAPVVELSYDRVARGKERYGSNR